MNRMGEALNATGPGRADGLRGYPPAVGGYRPEREAPGDGLLETGVDALFGGLFSAVKSRRNRRSGIHRAAAVHEAEMAGLGEAEIRRLVPELRLALCRRGFEKAVVARVFALLRELSRRLYGLRPHDVQLMGAWAMLSGMVAEMNTGEGKTLTATLAAGTAALAGLPVHVISVNEYLTARDAEFATPLCDALGLSVGCVTQEKPPEERCRAYACDITYCTNKDVVFDYLRDTIALKNRSKPVMLQAGRLCDPSSDRSALLQRGLFFAIVDEADSVLIDEARTPLIISGESGGEAEERFLREALEMAGSLTIQRDYTVDTAQRAISLLEPGKRAIETNATGLGALWRGTVRREEVVGKALSALHLFQKDEHYLVGDGKIQIVDEFTGRVMPDRSWEKGLHQLIEIKEGVEITRQRETLARISYQRFFRRYLRLSGMTGTAGEVRRELWNVYRLPVVKIPPNKTVRRTILPSRLFRTQEQKWDAVVDRVLELNALGRPVLVGTRSVAASEWLSRLLEDRHFFGHRVLNARQNREEADIVARAGETGAVTIATNMAGRGTDIALSDAVRQKSGLHVILTEMHEAGRIDRQLAGRCARQGDPGSFEVMLSMEDALLSRSKGLWVTGASLLARWGLPGWSRVGLRAAKRAQIQMEKEHARLRREMLGRDEKTGTRLSFSGRSE